MALPFLLLVLLSLSSASFSGVTGGAGVPPPQAAPEAHQESLLRPVLANLGFQEMAMATAVLPAMGLPAAWSGPLTVFAPSDDSIRSCSSCSPSRLLREHLVPGLFSRQYLSKLASPTKILTASPSRCLTITSFPASNSSDAKIFVDGVEITRPELFNDGRVVIHGLQGFVSPLSPLSCRPDLVRNPEVPGDVGAVGGSSSAAIVRLMLRDAIVRLRDGGFSILALAMRVKYPELAGLRNMTVFALDDGAIFAGGHAYVTNVRFHIVPDRLLMHHDLVRLPAGTILPTLVRGEHLVVTSPGGPFHGPAVGSGLRINYVPIKTPDVVYNARIAIHGIFLPLPHLYLADMTAESDDGIFDSATGYGTGTCTAGSGRCAGAPAFAPAVYGAEFEDDGL